MRIQRFLICAQIRPRERHAECHFPASCEKLGEGLVGVVSDVDGFAGCVGLAWGVLWEGKRVVGLAR